MESHSPLTRALQQDDDREGVLPGRSVTVLGREQALAQPAVLNAAREVLQAAFQTMERMTLLDPFAPASARRPEVIAVLRDAIFQHRQQGGPLARVPNDDDTLLALFDATLGWGPAQRYLDDPRVNEVKINGRTILVQETGKPFVVAQERFAAAQEVIARGIAGKYAWRTTGCAASAGHIAGQ